LALTFLQRIAILREGFEPEAVTTTSIVPKDPDAWFFKGEKEVSKTDYKKGKRISALPPLAQ